MKKLLNRLFSRMVITCLLVAAQLIFFMVEVLKLQQYYVLVAAILHLLSFIAVMHLLLKDVNPSIKLAWIVPILMFPVLGGLLYLLYGHIIMPKKLEKYMKHAAEWDYETDLYANMAYFSDVIKGQPPYRLFKYTEDYAGSLVYQNTDVRYYPMGEDVWPDFVDDLKSAKKYIFLEYFIINPGEMWNTVLEILKEKVKEGVEVRLIYDDIGSVFYVPKYYWRELESHGIKCMAFNQVVPFLATSLTTGITGRSRLWMVRLLIPAVLICPMNTLIRNHLMANGRIMVSVWKVMLHGVLQSCFYSCGTVSEMKISIS